MKTMKNLSRWAGAGVGMMIFAQAFSGYIVLGRAGYGWSFGYAMYNLIWLVGLILGIFLMFKAYQGEQFRVPVAADFAEWLPLWAGYNRFYGRESLPEEITRTTWLRFFDPQEPVRAVVAEKNRHLLGLAHYLFHRARSCRS